MSATFITDNIDRLQAVDLDSPRGWEITFRSENPALYHQLYVNGRLADFSDTADQRRFFLPAETKPRELAIAAVDGLDRHVDMSDLLPSSVCEPAWMYSVSAVRSIAHRPGDRLALYTDRATGQLDSTPLVVQEIWPPYLARWAWGEGTFGQDGFGFGGAGAPGLGKGAFGVGQFGIGAELLTLRAPLSDEGSHRIVLRTIASNGRTVDVEMPAIEAAPPPKPPVSISATHYDKVTQTLTLTIEES